MADDLKTIVLSRQWSNDRRMRLREQIRRQLLSSHHRMGGENFRQIHPDLLSQAFDAYDRAFFTGECRRRLEAHRHRLSFSFSKRMTNAAGMTVRHEQFDNSGAASCSSFEIKLSATLLFESFRENSSILVSGCRCHNRLDALMRVLEHEIVHLIEMLLWYDSNCNKERFRRIAQRFFAHRESTHQLIRPIDTARDRYGIKPGDRVTFEFDGRRLAGIVNRITRRATVLVPDPAGSPYSDGNRYAKYYVPINDLKRS